MIVVTFFLSSLNQMEFHLVQARKENCHHDHIPFKVKGNGNIVFSVQGIFDPKQGRKAAKIAGKVSVQRSRKKYVRETGGSRHHGDPIT